MNTIRRKKFNRLGLPSTAFPIPSAEDDPNNDHSSTYDIDRENDECQDYFDPVTDAWDEFDYEP